jgi:hypothetical protein
MVVVRSVLTDPEIQLTEAASISRRGSEMQTPRRTTGGQPGFDLNKPEPSCLRGFQRGLPALSGICHQGAERPCSGQFDALSYRSGWSSDFSMKNRQGSQSSTTLASFRPLPRMNCR